MYFKHTCTILLYYFVLFYTPYTCTLDIHVLLSCTVWCIIDIHVLGQNIYQSPKFFGESPNESQCTPYIMDMVYFPGKKHVLFCSSCEVWKFTEVKSLCRTTTWLYVIILSTSYALYLECWVWVRPNLTSILSQFARGFVKSSPKKVTCTPRNVTTKKVTCTPRNVTAKILSADT